MDMSYQGWTATLGVITKNDSGNLNVPVSFTDGVRTEQTFFNVMPASADDLNNLLKSQCIQQINYYLSQDAIPSILATPPSGQIDLSIPTPSALQVYLTARANLLTSKEDLGLGLIDQDTYNTQLQSVATLKAAIPSS